MKNTLKENRRLCKTDGDKFCKSWHGVTGVSVVNRK
jgi:hypothetical protein